jgi:hypothetical protein
LKHKISSLYEVQEETAPEQEEAVAPAATPTTAAAVVAAVAAVKEEKENNTEATLGNIGRMVYLDLQLGEGPLKDALSLDGTHVNAKIIPYIEQAITLSALGKERSKEGTEGLGV